MPAVSVDKTESRSEWSSSPGAQKTPLNKGILGGDGGEGFEPSRDLTAPSDFRDLLYFVSTMRSEGQCATTRDSRCLRTVVLVGASELALLLAGNRRRPRPYHGTTQATGRNPRQQFSLVWAVLEAVPFASDCHWLRLLGSIKGSTFVVPRALLSGARPPRTQTFLSQSARRNRDRLRRLAKQAG